MDNIADKMEKKMEEIVQNREEGWTSMQRNNKSKSPNWNSG